MQALTNRIAQHLDQGNVYYERLDHKRRHTPQQSMLDCQLDQCNCVKVQGIEADGRQLLAVLPADHAIDLPRFQRLLGVRRIARLPEYALATFFPDCEVGAYPPLGNLYGLPVYVPPALTQQEKITFSAGTHDQAIRMAYKDFDLIVRPTVMDFCRPTGHRNTGASQCRPY